ncbi:MAG: T9SS type A sorting domain-containing protein [Bacteroidales bacterium]|nr:T9SS type A sorting domain-containing protein [Bacteroidales bacterium]
MTTPCASLRRCISTTGSTGGTINITELTKGVYFLRVGSDNGFGTTKFVVK